MPCNPPNLANRLQPSRVLNPLLPPPNTPTPQSPLHPQVSELESILAVVMPWEGVGPPEESSGGAGVHSARSASAGPVLLQGRRRSSDSGGGGGMGGGGGGGATSGGGVGVGGIRNVILSGLSLKVGELVGGTTRYLGGGAAGGEQ